jgi:hypothetical protein
VADYYESGRAWSFFLLPCIGYAIENVRFRRQSKTSIRNKGNQLLDSAALNYSIAHLPLKNVCTVCAMRGKVGPADHYLKTLHIS